MSPGITGQRVQLFRTPPRKNWPVCPQHAFIRTHRSDPQPVTKDITVTVIFHSCSVFLARQVYEGANRDITGWTGTDCSMPMCTQGFFDPFCTDLAQAPGGEVLCPRDTTCFSVAALRCRSHASHVHYPCRRRVLEQLAVGL